MPSIVETLGGKVIDRSGEPVAMSTFTKPGRVVGLYFSSLWCHDRAFTPFLASFFSHFRMTDRGQHFEIVYVSADKDKEAFDLYYGEMPWHAISYDDLQTRSKLWKRFKVKATPTLVLLDGATGKLITTNGRDCLSNDLQGKDFPWGLKSLDEILTGELLKGSEKCDCKGVLDGKVKGFYFSAHWCPPCRIFTPQLAVTYEKLTEDGKNFEIVFISSDRSESSFTEYYGSMPSGWLALPYRDERCMHLTRLFAVEGIPTLVLVDEEGKTISRNARFVVSNDVEGKDYPWRAKPVDELTEANCCALHEAAALIYFTDGDMELIESGRALLAEVADNYIAKRTASIDTDDELPEIRFYYEGVEYVRDVTVDAGRVQSEEIADTLRSFAQLDSRKPLVVILDPVEQRVYTLEAVMEVNRASVEELIEEFKQAVNEFNPLLASPDDSEAENLTASV